MTIRQGIKSFFAAIKAKLSATQDVGNTNTHDNERFDASSSGEITIASLRSDKPIPGRDVVYAPRSIFDSDDYGTPSEVTGRSAPLSPGPSR